MANAVTIIVDGKSKTLVSTEVLVLGSSCDFRFVDKNTYEPLDISGACVLRLLPKPYQRGKMDDRAPFGAFVFTNGTSGETTILREEWLVSPLSFLPVDTTVSVHATIVTEEGPIATGMIDILVATVAGMADSGDRVALFKGDKGDKGDALTYDMLTDEQKEALRGEQGEQGVAGVKGDRGDPNVYVGSEPPETLPPFIVWVDPNGTPSDVPTLPTAGNVGDILYLSKIEDGKIVVGWGDVSGVDGKTYEPIVRKDANGTYIDFAIDGEVKIEGTVNVEGADGADGADGVDGTDGKNGSYYVPSIVDGVLTWTNSEGLPSPDPVDLKAELSSVAPLALCQAMLDNVGRIDTTIIRTGTQTQAVLIEQDSFVFIHLKTDEGYKDPPSQLTKVYANIGGLQADTDRIVVLELFLGATSNYCKDANTAAMLLPRGTVLTFSSTGAAHQTTCTIKVLPLDKAQE